MTSGVSFYASTKVKGKILIQSVGVEFPRSSRLICMRDKHQGH